LYLKNKDEARLPMIQYIREQRVKAAALTLTKTAISISARGYRL